MTKKDDQSSENRFTPQLKATAQSKDLPWTAEQLALTRNETYPVEPPELTTGMRTLLFSGDEKSIPTFDKVDGGWSLSVPDGVRMGIEARAEEPAEMGCGRSSVKLETPAYRPAGTPIIYHPPVLGHYPERIVKRRNGRRMQQHGVIFNGDDREIFNPSDDYPWRCAGQLRIWNRPGAFFWDPPDSSGTAALVGPNMIVTSSHMIPEGLSRFTAIFLPGLFGTKRSFDLFSYVRTWRQYLPYDQGSDIAIMRLHSPIGEQLGWFGTKTYDDDWEDSNVWTRIGYGPIPAKGSDGTRPNRVLNFPIIDDDDSYGVELEYRSDAGPGDSGGPVFAWWDSIPHIVGVHSGGEVEFELSDFGHFFASLNNVAAGGPALPDMVNWGWTNWR